MISLMCSSYVVAGVSAIPSGHRCGHNQDDSDWQRGASPAEKSMTSDAMTRGGRRAYLVLNAGGLSRKPVSRSRPR
ncbi:MAG TPA: hypothetical protein VJ890_05850 [Vineibacter sp.]|nr:hypothetical protein [Vineibacter sp.]